MTVMSPELPSQAEPQGASGELGAPGQRARDWAARRPEDEAVEAIVYDVHPALVAARARRTSVVYPYGPPVATTADSTGAGEFHVRPEDIYKPLPSLFQFDLPEARVDYVVPQRFGLAAILGMTTALAILFACMRRLDADPGWYLFYGFQSVVICIVQMFQGRSPRRASAIAGAIMGPIFILLSAWISPWENGNGGFVFCVMVMMVPCGAFLGYLNGTCAAGIFLVMDKLEKYLKGDADQPSGAGAPISSPAVPAS